jgi:hypothetical protein
VSSHLLEALPEQLTTGRLFVVWKEELRNGNTTKVPYSPEHPQRRARVNDPSTWSTFEVALTVETAGAASGIGRVLGDGLTVVDIDSCRDPESGVIAPAALAIVSALESYTEVSPSGTGLHVWCNSSLPPGGRRTNSLEMYDTDRYITLTGRHLPGTLTIEQRTQAISDLHARVFGSNDATLTATDERLIQQALAERGGQRFWRLWNGDKSEFGGDHSRADLALCNMLACVTRDEAVIDRLFRRSMLMRQKWDERRGASTYGERTVRRTLGTRNPSSDATTGLTGSQRDQHGRTPHTAPLQPKLPSSAVSHSTQIMRLALAENVELFQDIDETPYAAVRVTGHREIYQLRSRRFRTWLSGLYFLATERVAGAQALADALNVLEAHALRAAVRPVAVRLARQDDSIYLDLGDAEWRVVEITGKGWTVLHESPIPFRRPKGLLPMPLPARGGSLTALRQFVNVSTDEDFSLVVAFILGVLRALKPYPILVVNGEHGSAKSTLTAVIRELTDPNAAPLRAEPTDAHNLMIAAANAHLISYDNLSHLRLTDELSRLATGAGFAVRTLYENREEEIFTAARPIILNGIPEIATKPDLASRSLFLTLPAIEDTNRRNEAAFWDEFQVARPSILGAALDAIAVALANWRTVNLSRKPRMADFATWIVAAETACPWPPGRLLAAYEANRRGAIGAILDGDSLGELALEVAPWEGTATALLDQLNGRATDQQKAARHWYRSPRQVRDALQRIAPALREEGVRAVFGEKDKTRNRNRLIRLERLSPTASVASAASDGLTSSHRGRGPDGRTQDVRAPGLPHASACSDAVDRVSDNLDGLDASAVHHHMPAVTNRTREEENERTENGQR